MGALVKRDPGQRERKERGEKASKKRKKEKKRRSWDRGTKERETEKEGMDGEKKKRGNYAARRGNWQVENFQRRDLPRRSRDLVTNKGGFRRIRRRGADNKLQNCHTAFQKISYLIYSEGWGGGKYINIYGKLVFTAGALLIACLRGGSWQIALLFLSSKRSPARSRF